jgi:tRNA threonylcarbamoyladenosine biosynthesis protein TsaE
MKLVAKSMEDTKRAAELLLGRLATGPMAQVVALQGELGAGKTNFAQMVGKLLGVKDNMHSPTFVIMKVYEIDFKGFKNLIHIDAYRLEKDEELLHLGWEEILKGKENLILIEWPENVSKLIPESAQKVSFTWVDEGTREINFYENE